MAGVNKHVCFEEMDGCGQQPQKIVVVVLGVAFLPSFLLILLVSVLVFAPRVPVTSWASVERIASKQNSNAVTADYY